MRRLMWTTWAMMMVTAGVALGVGFGLGIEQRVAIAADQAAWAPKLYGLCVDMPGGKRPFVEQVAMLRELGFDGVGHSLWLGADLDKNLKLLDDAGLPLLMVYTGINVNPAKPPHDARVPDAIRRLKGRPVTVCVTLVGLPPGDPKGEEQAVKVLRQLGDIAAEAGSRISIYHHTGDWTQSLLFALEVIKKVNHPQVGVNFNLCHWLRIDGDKDYRPVLRDNASKIFVATINGAQLGTKTWTNGLIQPLDQGDFDNRALLATLREVSYRGPIGLMCYGIPGDSREHLPRSMKVWKTWRAEWTGKDR